MVAFYWMLISDLLARSVVTSQNRKLRTKPFMRPPDQVVRTWSWSMGRQNTPYFGVRVKYLEFPTFVLRKHRQILKCFIVTLRGLKMVTVIFSF